MKMTTSKLIELINLMAKVVGEVDSFEGNLQYSIAEENDMWDVTAAIRHGNTEGQGSILLIE